MSFEESNEEILVDKKFIHDLNNYLFGASSQLELASKKLGANSDVRPNIEKSLISIQEAKLLLKKVSGKEINDISTPVQNSSPPSKQNKTVIVMDDDQIILESMDEYLNDNGYDVMLASNEEQALRIISKKSEEIDIAILDLNIPEGPGGIYVLEELKKINPEIKVIISSGYIPPDIEESIKLIDPACKTVKKPFRFAQIEEVLNSF